MSYTGLFCFSEFFWCLSIISFQVVRIIPLSSKMKSLLHAFAEAEKLASEDFIFHGDSRDKPIDYKATNRALYRALGKIGIDRIARKERNVTFHS